MPTSFWDMMRGQELMDNFSEDSIRKPQSFDSIYSDIQARTKERFGDSVVVSNYNPTESDVYHISVLFDRKRGVSHDTMAISSVINNPKLGYFKKSRVGNNDYEMAYHGIMVEKSIPLNVMYSERYSAVRKPNTICATIKAYESPLEARNCIKNFDERKGFWNVVDDLQRARKKLAYIKVTESEIPEGQTAFTEDGIAKIKRERGYDDVGKYIKRQRNGFLLGIRNDIVLTTSRGMVVEEVKSSCEINDRHIKLLYKQMMAYDAERKFYNDYTTPLMLTVPVLPPEKELSMLEKVKSDSRRPIGVMCIADMDRFILETKNGIKELKYKASRNSSREEEYHSQEGLLRKYQRNFSK